MTNQIPINGPNGQKPHFVLVPQLAQGHMIPMVDMARLLADRGATVTLITTPINASRISTIIDRVGKSVLPIRFVPLRFPCTETGLPEGCENIDVVPSRDLLRNFAEACAMLREPLLLHLREQQPSPSCIISDASHGWTQDVARAFGIPRLIFHGFGCFSILCWYTIRNHNFLENITDENEPCVVPGLPHRIEITKAQSPENFTGPGLDKFLEEMKATELAADGVVMNSFDDLENSYIDCYKKAIGKKVWTIGPMSLYNRNVTDMAVRGNKSSIDENRCLSWLDSMKPISVVYVSFGSLACTPPSQLIEIGLGLEASNCPFIWVIKAGDDKSSEEEEWLSEGFEERTSTRGLIIRGWAPQMVILSHPAVGGFMTHCGWNSALESVSAGVPMITWPHFAEQFLNEKLIVEVLKIGVAVGPKVPTTWEVENSGVIVKRDSVGKAVCTLMDEGKEGAEIRDRARELGQKAMKAMEKGGSSYENMAMLVQEINTNVYKI